MLAVQLLSQQESDGDELTYRPVQDRLLQQDIDGLIPSAFLTKVFF